MKKNSFAYRIFIPNKLYILLTVLTLVPFFPGCKFGGHEMFWRANPVDKRSTSFVNLTETLPKPLPNQYDCLIITDTHFGNKNYTTPTDSFFKQLENYIAEKGSAPAFCIILGDIVDHGIEKEYSEFKQFQNTIEHTYNIPCYNVVGNHDLYNSGWKLWKEISKPYTSCYYFQTKKFDWYFLDTASGTLGRPQFYNLKNKLTMNSKPKLIFTHYPLYGDKIFYFSLSNPREIAELISLFSKTNVKLYCSGHYHSSRFYDFGPFQEYVVAAFGEFKKFHILHIDEDKQYFTIEHFNIE